jgi:preprotein translocase subunit SecE
MRKPPEKNKLYSSNNTGNLNDAIEENGWAGFVFMKDFWGSTKKTTWPFRTQEAKSLNATVTEKMK